MRFRNDHDCLSRSHSDSRSPGYHLFFSGLELLPDLPPQGRSSHVR